MIAISADGEALLAEIMRKRAQKIAEEIGRLERERSDIAVWLAEHDPEPARSK